MIKKKKTKKSGVCQLTGDFGPFQRSHILPKAVTKLSDNGERYRETSLNTRPVWRSNSWYDYNLVTAKGEKILSEIDDLAISELRKHKLIWSGFGPKWKNSPTSYRLDEPVRTVSGLNTKLVRLFFISLLWRAAASQREEMSDIYLPQQELDVLKLMIVRKESGEPGFLPMYINQISNIGVHHNRTPIYEKQVIGDIEVDTFRFYSLQRSRAGGVSGVSSVCFSVVSLSFSHKIGSFFAVTTVSGRSHHMGVLSYCFSI